MSSPLAREVLRFMQEAEGKNFDELAISIFEYQRRKNPVFAKYCETIGVTHKVDSWKQIPALPQIAFKRAAIRSFPAEQTRAEFRTSGTTGEGHGKHFFPSLHLYETAVQKGWDYFRLPRGGFTLLMQHPADAPFSSLSYMGGILAAFERNRFLIGQNGELKIDRLSALPPADPESLVVFGTALAFLQFMERFPDHRLELPPGTIAMETGGFKGSGREIGKRELYSQMSHWLGIEIDSIWNEYGMTELSSQFYSRGIGRSHHGPPWTRFQIIDPETNQEAAPNTVGLLRIFDLANLWSVIGIQTQDLAIGQPDGGFLLLGRDPAALPRGCSRAVDELLKPARG
jgi:hypothetical protein